MIRQIRRYARAFVLAGIMTLRGEVPPPRRYPELELWTQQTETLVGAVKMAAEAQGMDAAARILLIDHRNISMETILETVLHHAATEYPSLMRARRVKENVLAVQATNLNDRFLVYKLEQSDLAEPVRAAVSVLKEHLDQLPTVVS
jgi:hypothetical protein